MATQSSPCVPVPDAALLEHSRNFVAALERRIGSSLIPFSDYMQAALYQPGFGYYVSGAEKFGARGDFTTAPETSQLFGACLAQQCQEILSSLQAKQRSVFEFGAGTGRLALQILTTLEQLNCLPQQYLILEPSGELRKRQHQLLQRLPASLFARVQWLDHLPSQLQGVVIANEVMDAMPVERFDVVEAPLHDPNLATGSVLKQQFVGVKNGTLSMQRAEASPAVVDAVQHIEESVGRPFAPGYSSEINMNLPAWLASLDAVLSRGAVLLIDYGYPRAEFYMAERTQGTLMCYFQHHAHSDPFYIPSGQDITAHVDFTQVVESGVEAGFELNGFTTQSAFLRGNNLLGFADELNTDNTIERLRLASEIKKLSLPGEMGDSFNVMALSKGISFALRGFTAEDASHRL